MLPIQVSLIYLSSSPRRRGSSVCQRFPARHRDKPSETTASSAPFSGCCGTRHGLLFATHKQPQTVLADPSRKLSYAKSGGLIVSEGLSRWRAYYRRQSETEFRNQTSFWTPYPGGGPGSKKLSLCQSRFLLLNQLQNPIAGQIQHGIELFALERRLLGSALHLNKAAGLTHDHVHIGVCR